MKLTPNQNRAINALLEHTKIGEASAAAGVTERTMTRYLKNPEFQNALREASNKAIDTAVTRLSGAAGGAVETLVTIQDDKNAPYTVRVSAARAILNNVIKLTELRDLSDRVAAIEAGLEKLA